MFNFLTLNYIIILCLFIIILSYFILFIVKHKVYDHRVLFVFVIIIAFFLLIYLIFSAIRNSEKIGIPISPIFTFIPQNYTILDNLPVNRYPLLGSHDSATFVKYNTNNSATLKILIGLKNQWLYTQSLDFYEQYKNGVRLLDFRFQYSKTDKAVTFRHGDGVVFGQDIGGIFFPITDPHYKSLDTFLEQAISDQDIVILKITKEKNIPNDNPLYNNENMSLWTGDYFMTDPDKGKTSIMANVAYYLSNTHSHKNYLSSTVFISNESELNNSVSSFKSKGKYIFVIMDTFIQSNWDPNVVCQNKPINSLHFSYECNTNTCINPDDSSWTSGKTNSSGLFNYMNTIGTAYNTILNTSSKLNITQAMFQSYSGLSGLWLGLPLPFQDCTNGDITMLESYAHVTYRIYKYLTSNPTYLANITIMDNVGVEISPFSIDGIVQLSWSKMVSYQLKENYMNSIALRNPFLTQYLG